MHATKYFINAFVGDLYNLFLQQLVSTCTGHGLQASRYEPFMLLKQLQASVALSNVGLVPEPHNKIVWNFFLTMHSPHRRAWLSGAQNSSGF